MAVDVTAHLVLGMFGFGCSLVPLCARVPGALPEWAPHAVMAAAMAAMALLGMVGPAAPPLAGALLLVAAWAWYRLPRREEWLHVVVDLATMAFLLLVAPSHGPVAGVTPGHGSHGALPASDAVAPVAILLFWLGMHGSCRARPQTRPCLRDFLSSLGMVASMAVMVLLG